MKTLSRPHSTSVFTLGRFFALMLMVSACTDTYVVDSLKTTDVSASYANIQTSQGWGPETPNFNLEAILRGEGEGFGLVKFRQPNDDKLIIYLDTWVRGLEPNTSYQLQRAVDTNLDGNCTSTAWLTLGKGLEAQAIVTDDNGSGRAELFRSVAAFPVGSTFDIHFQVVNKNTSAVALMSDCYQFTISQ